MHTALRLGIRAAERIRALNPRAHLCFHGVYAQLQASLLLGGVADSVASGEAEEALVGLARALDGGATPDDLPGISRPGRIVGPVLAKLDFPPPAETGLPPPERYARLALGDGEERLAGYLEASRGCRHRCGHCPITPVYQGRFFVVPAAQLLASAEAQIARGVRHLTFGDPDFWNGPGHAEAIVRELHRRHPGVTYDATIKVEHLLRERARLPVLAETGCAFITSAFESLSDRVLAALDKGHTARDAAEAVRLLDDHGLPLRPTFVAFTPWTTAEDFLAMLRFLRDHDLGGQLDRIQFALRLLVPLGSALLARPIPGLGPLRADGLTYDWVHPDPRMDELQGRLSAWAAATRDDPGEALPEVERLAETALGLTRPRAASPPRRRPRAPALTESWFC